MHMQCISIQCARVVFHAGFDVHMKHSIQDSMCTSRSIWCFFLAMQYSNFVCERVCVRARVRAYCVCVLPFFIWAAPLSSRRKRAT